MDEFTYRRSPLSGRYLIYMRIGSHADGSPVWSLGVPEALAQGFESRWHAKRAIEQHLARAATP